MEVRVEIRDGRIAAKPFPDRRFPGDKEMSKSIPGAKWNDKQYYWHYPLTLTSCRILRSVYTDMLKVGPELSKWARIEIKRSEEMRDFALQQDADLLRIPAVAPIMDTAMGSRTYQRVGARYIGMNKNVLLADEPTLGKTIQYLGGLIEAGNEVGNHLIIAPKSSLYSVWAEEVFKWSPFHPFWMPDGRPRREDMMERFFDDEYGSKFLIVNPDMLQTLIAHHCKKCDMWEPTRAEEKKMQTEGKVWWPMNHYTDAHNTKPKIKKQDWPQLFEVVWDSVCIDEAHLSLLGNRGAKKTQTAEGLTRLRIREGGMRIASTGTPLKGRAINFWSVFNWLQPTTYTSKWAWAEAYLDISDNGFGKTIGDVRPDREQALYESLRPVMLRRTKKEVQPDLPDDQYIDHWVELDGAHARQYNEMVLEGETEIEGGALTTNGILSEYTRQKQFAFGAWRRVGKKMSPDPSSSPKMDLLLELLDRRGVRAKDPFRLEGGGWKYMVGSQFTDIVDFLEYEFNSRGILSEKITGAVTSANRRRIKTDWQNDDTDDAPRVLFVNTKAGGTALTLDAMCDEMFILDETWTRDDQIQLEGRIKNRDVEKRVATRSFHYIRTRGTIEEEISESGLTQDEFQKTIMDRSRGLRLKKREIKR